MSVVSIIIDDRVARVRLDRPPLNVVDLVTARELTAALDGLHTRRDLVAVVFESAGKAFCAGVDVRDHLPDRGAETLAAFHAACERLHALPCPTVAAVHGPALGGGCELTLVCDVVVASTRATFAQPEIKLGVFPPLAAVALARVAPAHLAADLVLTGRSLPAAEAQAAGLVSRLVEPEQFEAAVAQVLGELRALSAPSLALTKRALRVARPPVDFAAVAAAERLYVQELMSSPDAIEGLTAFVEKRAPKWGG